MKSSFLVAVLIITAPLFIYSSCKKTVTASNHNTEKCNPNVMCTMMFAMVTARISDVNGKPVKLDEYYTLRPQTGEKIKATENMEGFYTILDDSYQKTLQQSSDKFQFIGLKDGKQVVNETYIISADCCHIQKQSGKSEIIIK